MGVHTTSFVLHPKGMSPAPESRNLIFLLSLPLRPFLPIPPSVSVCRRERGGQQLLVRRAAAAQRPLCERMPHALRRPSVRPSATICVHTLLHIARGRRGGGYAWDGHDFVSISALQKRLIYGKLCESLIAEERHATNSHLPAQRMQRNRMYASRVA